MFLDTFSGKNQRKSGQRNNTQFVSLIKLCMENRGSFAKDYIDYRELKETLSPILVSLAKNHDFE